jgi:RNA-directed DNA polymerase
MEEPTSSLNLLECILSNDNIKEAWKQVRTNKGAPGIDGITVEEFPYAFRECWSDIRSSILAGKYKPSPVLRVEIPKPDGNLRPLGIPTVLDRLIQQALHQVLESIFDPTFSEFSFGFRRGRSAHHAIKQAKKFQSDGRDWVVDMDLAKFFDEVNHDLLIARVRRKVDDKRVIYLIRQYLRSGVVINRKVYKTTKGTPQGGPLSPLLSNIMLDDLDKELERRGHAFCRYADDCNIYVRSQRSGERVLESVTLFVEKKLKLKVAVLFIDQREKKQL